MMFSGREVDIPYLSQMMSHTNQQLVFDDHNSLFGQENGSGLNPIDHFPSYDHAGFSDLPPAAQLMPPPPPSAPPRPGDVMTTDMARQRGRKRAVRRDRHSKIETASGLRDRRMRLSLDVATKFFKLQDVLGFDKASKTVEWLLTKSKGAIRSLMACRSRSEHPSSGGGGGNPMESSVSECEVDEPVVMDDDVDDNDEERAVTAVAAAVGGDQVHAVGVVAPKSRRPSGSRRRPRKSTSDPMPTKESRAKARARAKERTEEKRKWISRSENATLQKQYLNLGSEVEHPNDDWKRSPALGGGGQSFPAAVMCGHDEYGGLISTSDLNYTHHYHHHHSILHVHNPDPFNSLQDYRSLHTSSLADATGEQRATINDAHIQARVWEEINHLGSSI